MPYDALGNYVPGDDEPSIDQMRLELANQPTSGRRQETEAEYKARMVNQLPPAFGVQEFRYPVKEVPAPVSTSPSVAGQFMDRTGISALPQVIGAMVTGYPAAIAKEMGYPDVAGKIQYEPTSRYANELLESIGKTMEEYKVPPWIGHIPGGRRMFSPNDLRALGGETSKIIREVKDIPTDFRNAQAGLKRQDIFGQPTLGTRLQGGAESLADTMARREMQGLSAVPGIPASLVPETRMYAVRPANYGQILEQSDLPGKPGQYASGNTYTVRDIIEDIRPPVEGGSPGHKLATYERNFFSPIDGLREVMRQLEFTKIREMYPDAPTEADAIDAYRRTRSDREQIQDKLNWYDEFRQNQTVSELIGEYNYDRQMIIEKLNEAKMEKKKGLPPQQVRDIDARIQELEAELRRTPAVDLPSQEEYNRRIKAADTYLNTQFKNDIKKYIGSPEGPMMTLAKKGITFKPASEIIEQAKEIGKLRPRSGSGLTVEGDLTLAREKAGFNPKGETSSLVESSELQLKEAQDKLDALNSEKFALREQHFLEHPEILDPAQNPGETGTKYKALTNKIESAASARDKAKKELDNFRLANAYELLSDYAYVPTTAGELSKKIPYAERVTAFPNLAKTPDEAPMFNLRETVINDAMGLKDAGEAYSEAIIRGDIPLDKNNRPTKSFEKFIEESTEHRRRQEDLERKLESRKTELLDTYAKDTLNNIPDELKFGNSAVLELTNHTPYGEVRRQISFDGSVFDHCIAATDSPHPGTNPYTGRRYSYSFPVDPATGINRSPKSSSHMEQVKNGDAMIASMRDKNTGLPAASIQFKNKDADGKYILGYVSSYGNDPVPSEYRNDLRDYLNYRSDLIRDVDSGLAALYKSSVYDTRGSRRQLENSGLDSRDIEILQNSDHPRFITNEDLEKLRSTPDESRNGLMEQKRMAQVELDEAEMRLEDLRRGDPDNAEGITFAEETINDLRLQLQDLDQRIARLPTQNVPSRTNMDLAGRRFDVIANAINTGDRAVSAELQSLARRHAIGSDEFGSALAQRIEELPDEPANLRRDLSNALDQWRQSSTVQRERLPSNDQLRRTMREGEVAQAHATFRYLVEAERFSDDFNWDHEGQMNAINAIRNNDDLTAVRSFTDAADIRMINQLNPRQRELLARELEQNFIVNMEHSLDGGVVSLADFEGEVPGITRFYEDAQARAEGQLANPEARSAPEVIQGQDNLGNGMTLQAARNTAFGPLDDTLRQDAVNIVDTAILRHGANDLPAIRQAVVNEATAIDNYERFNHLDMNQRRYLVGALNNFANEIAPAPQAAVQVANNPSQIINRQIENIQEPAIRQEVRNVLYFIDENEEPTTARSYIDALEDATDNLELDTAVQAEINNIITSLRHELQVAEARPINPRNNPELVNFDQHTQTAARTPQYNPRDIALSVNGVTGENIEGLTDQIENVLRNINASSVERLQLYRRVFSDPNLLPQSIIDYTHDYPDLERIANYLIEHIDYRLANQAPAERPRFGTREYLNQLEADAIANENRAQVATDLNQALQESLESARGLHTARHVNSALDAVNDISNDIDLTDNPTEFISRIRGRADNSQPEVSAVLNSIADDLETAIEQAQPQQPQRRVRRVRGEPGSLTRVMNHAIDQLTNENTGSMQAYTSFMNELEGQTRETVEARLREAISLTGDQYSDLAMQRFNVDSPAGLSQLNRAFNYTFENLPQNFAAGGLVRMKNGGIAKMKDGSTPPSTDSAGYSDSLKIWGDTAEKIAPEGKVRGSGDAARHIIASADIARRYGRIPAAVAGYGHEFLNLIQGDQTVDDFLQDIRNNSLGRDIGANAKSFEDIVGATKESLSGVKPYEKIPGKAYIMEMNKSMQKYQDGGSVSIDDMRLALMKGK